MNCGDLTQYLTYGAPCSTENLLLCTEKSALSVEDATWMSHHFLKSFTMTIAGYTAKLFRNMLLPFWRHCDCLLRTLQSFPKYAPTYLKHCDNNAEMLFGSVETFLRHRFSGYAAPFLRRRQAFWAYRLQTFWRHWQLRQTLPRYAATFQ